MYCPRCVEVELRVADRQGVEIDFCPKCRGVWMDRGELDKIIERSAAYESDDYVDLDAGFEKSKRGSPPRAEPRPPMYRRDEDDDRRYEEDHYRSDRDRRPDSPQKKKSFLGDLFDIFD